jgi:hypothetical protein
VVTVLADATACLPRSARRTAPADSAVPPDWKARYLRRQFKSCYDIKRKV